MKLNYTNRWTKSHVVKLCGMLSRKAHEQSDSLDSLKSTVRTRPRGRGVTYRSPQDCCCTLAVTIVDS